jgi:hypothetical protein
VRFPPSKSEAVLGVTSTLATGTVLTVTEAVPVRPSDDARIVAVPAATPVTRPVAFTVAMFELRLVQLTLRPVSGAPVESRGVAVSWRVPPTEIFEVLGVTDTEFTGTWATATETVPTTPSLCARTVAVPTATPVTTPCAETVATLAFVVVQVTTRPVRALPSSSRGTAVTLTV